MFACLCYANTIQLINITVLGGVLVSTYSIGGVLELREIGLELSRIVLEFYCGNINVKNFIDRKINPHNFIGGKKPVLSNPENIILPTHCRLTI